MTLFLEANEFWSCNFKCPICFVAPYVKSPTPEQLTQEAKATYEFFEPAVQDFLATYPDGYIKVEGGEPLFYFDKFIHTVQEIRKRHPNPITTVSNCSFLENPKKLEQFNSSGVTKLECSLNSHIPEEHNCSRGLPRNHSNCEFILSLPKKLGSVIPEINAIPCEYNIKHLKDFTKKAYDLGFNKIIWCFYRRNSSKLWLRENRHTLIKFYLWIQRQTGDFREFIRNSDDTIQQTIKWYLTGKIYRKCKAPERTIFINYNNIIYPCWGLFEIYKTKEDKSFIYSPGDIINPASRFNSLRKSLPEYCFNKCSLDACYF